MDPVTLIITALASGASAGLTDTASTAIKETYSALKSLLTRKFAGKSDAERALAGHEQEPESWEQQLRDALKECGADRDDEIVRAAEGVLQTVHAEQSSRGKYNVQFTGAAQGNIVGEGATVNQSFGGPPPASD